tara:strand:+ start:4026 stop:4640 length:615 start_codon:yes stop_codon:yes gene_type:complete
MAMRYTQTIRFAALTAICTAICAGCAGHTPRDAHADAAQPSATLSIDRAAGDELVFDAARETLMDYRFALDRVDARRGVITTHPKRTAGIATPWDQEQSGIDQEWEDLLNEQRRVVRVEFDRDEQAQGEPITELRVLVEVIRTHRPGWRVQTESVRLSNHARTRNREGELEPGSFGEVVGLDHRFAARIAEAINQRISRGAGEQ